MLSTIKLLTRVGLVSLALMGPLSSVWAQDGGDSSASESGEEEPSVLEDDFSFVDDYEDEDFDDEFGEDLLELDLEALLEVECTVVSRKSESVKTAPAAVYVISGDEIRRAGHASVQEALRMVPGTFVSRWNTQDTDATIRGFGPGTAASNLAYLNQVLVMIDGVVVYTPLFAGMWWGLQDLDMEHIDRIEVIRGPSGILWGANAFHGLINVVTKTGADTRGQRLSARFSRDEQFITARAGGDVSETVSFSAFARRSRYDALSGASGFFGEEADEIAGYGINSGGFQLDGDETNGRTWRLWARGYEADVRSNDFFVGGPTENHQYGGQAAFQFNDEDTGTMVRLAYVKENDRIRSDRIDVGIDQLQFEASRTASFGEHNRLIFGIGYDRIRSDTSFFDAFYVSTLRQNNLRGFVSDTWTIPSWDLALTLGAQAIEHQFSGFDLQPSVRASWTPEGKGTFWGSVSRAVRTPSIEEEVFGGGTLEAESVVAAEAGWRGEISTGTVLDVTAYLNDYDDVAVYRFDAGTGAEFYTNEGTGRGKGIELALDVKATERWTIRSAYAYHRSSHLPDGVDFSVDLVDGQYPVHLFNVRSYYDLGGKWELDAAIYAAQRFDIDGGGDGPEYWRGDLRLGWQAAEGVRLTLGVQGAHDPVRSEFGQEEVRRQLYFGLDASR